MTFVQRDAAPEERRSYFDAEAMTDDTWINGNRGERAKYVARRRAEDPETALALVEAEWSGLDVESKVRLVSALRVRSNPSDVPFLRTLLKERSPRIKDAARALLARLPGYAGDNPNLREAVSRIERRRGDPSSFDLRLPSNVSQYGADQWIVSTFTGFGVGELAEALGTAPEQLVTAAVPDERLLCGIMVSATSDARFDIVSEITENFLHAKQDFMILNEIHGTEQLTPSERLQWLAAALRPRQWAEVSSVALERISDMLEDFLPADMAGAVFGSAAMKRFLLAGRLGVDHFEMLAAMCPRELRAELMAMLAPHVPRAETAILFLELMNILEK
jgi:uncharacterized protein YqfB (UPF0267 family)